MQARQPTEGSIVKVTRRRCLGFWL
jgi:hypothetical protein